jgi:large subunit ribosomal protein L9
MLATPEAIKNKERLVARHQQETEADEAALGELFEKINAKTVAIASRAKDDKLFGSIGAKEIAEALKEFDAQIDASAVVLAKPLKTVGKHEITVTLGKKVAKVTINVLAE